MRANADSAGAVGTDIVRFAHDFDMFGSTQELCEHHPQLQPGEAHSDTLVGKAAKGKLAIGLVFDIERAGIEKGVGVAIGRGIKHHEVIAATHFPVADLDVALGGADEMNGGRSKPQRLFDRLGRQFGLCAKFIQLIGGLSSAWRPIPNRMNRIRFA